MILTVDIGNSRVKWALWMVERIIARGVISYGAYKRMETFDQLFSTVQQPEKVFAVCVADSGMQQLLSDWVSTKWQLEVDYLKTQKRFNHIKHAYKNPEHHGVDRWAGVVAAQQMFPDSAVCVISAGTALTFDLMKDDGQHLGGYIMPSVDTMFKSLMKDTAKINARYDSAEGGKHDSSIPDNTDDAVNMGVNKMMQASIRDICTLASQKLGTSMKIIITGGGAKSILNYPEMPMMEYKPDLIMQGLYDIKMHAARKNNTEMNAVEMQLKS